MWLAAGSHTPVGANRGASGIDGVLSSAAGFAEGLRRGTTLVIGDVSFLHDVNGLNLLRTSGEPLTPLQRRCRRTCTMQQHVAWCVLPCVSARCRWLVYNRNPVGTIVVSRTGPAWCRRAAAADGGAGEQWRRRHLQLPAGRRADPGRRLHRAVGHPAARGPHGRVPSLSHGYFLPLRSRRNTLLPWNTESIFLGELSVLVVPALQTSMHE